jgi:hypothetical protein
VRVFTGLLAAVLVAVACGESDGPERPEESARPDLTAEQIGTELEKAFPSAADDPPGYRTVTTEQRVRHDGSREEITTEEVVIGTESYTRYPDGIESLTYNGRTYVTTDPAADWRTPEEIGFDFSALDDYFANLGTEFASVPADIFESAGAERVPDEFVNDRHALVVRVNMDDVLEIFLRGLEQTLEELPPVTPDSDDPAIPDRQTGDAQFWIDAETLEPLRVRMEIFSYKDNQETERLIVETVYADFGEVFELPVDLPDSE